MHDLVLPNCVFACTLARKAGVIGAGLFKGAIAVIALALLLSTPWTLAIKKFIDTPIDPLKPKKTFLWL